MVEFSVISGVQKYDSVIWVKLEIHMCTGTTSRPSKNLIVM